MSTCRRGPTLGKGPKLLASLLLAAACTSRPPEGAAAAAALGPESTVERGDVERLVVVDGNLYSPSSQALSIQRIRWYWDYNISWTADEGSTVKAGDPVVKLDPSTIQKDLDERELSLAQQRLELEEETLRAQDEVADAQAGVKTAEFDLKKEELMLTDSDAVSEAEKKKQRLKVQSAEASLRRAREKVEGARLRSQRKIESQKIRVKKAEEEVEDLRAGLEKTTLTAPQDGLVTFPLYSSNAGWQKARPGAGVQANTVVAEVSDTGDLVARVYVPEIDADGIASGTTGSLTLDILPGAAFPGKVRSVASVPSTPAERDGNKSPKPSDNVRQFEVLFEVPQLPPDAMPGMTAQVTLRTLARENVVRVPTEALTNRPLPVGGAGGGGKAGQALAGDKGDGGGTEAASGRDAFVYARRKDAAAGWEWRPVKLGAQSLTYAEVVDGLAEGDAYRALVW